MATSTIATGASLAALDGSSVARVTSARVSIPAWGASYADVTVDGAVTLSGAVKLTIADLVLQCTVLSGGPTGEAGRSYFRLVTGAGGWGKAIRALSYATPDASGHVPFGVRAVSAAGASLMQVLSDAASEVGETLDATTIPSTNVGFFVRSQGPACRLLEQLAPNAWYVGEDGKTRIGQRPATTFAGKAARTSELDLAAGTLTLASATIANILPGLTVDGLTAVDVEHEFTVEGGLRSRIWGKQAAGTSRRLAALRAILDKLDPGRKFRSVYEYRVVTQDGEHLNLQPVRVSTGMPFLSGVRVRPGVPGAKAQHVLGSYVLVTFVDGDPGRPIVIGFPDPESGGFAPNVLELDATALLLAGGGAAVGRVGDSVQVTFTATDAAAISAPPGTGGGPCTLPGGSLTLTGQITAGSPKVTSG